LSATLGPISSVEARGGIGDLVHLVVTHGSGATSTATLSLQVPPDATDSELVLWGAQGLVRMPPRSDSSAPAYRKAVAHLVAAAEGAPGAADDPVDLSFGVRVTELLHTAERRIAETRAAGDPC
jgi:hypothetical protein